MTSIGLFVNASGVPIDSSVERVYTSGYSTVGIGGADYYYDSAVDSTYVTNNPRTSFLADDDRGFRVDNYMLNPKMMGCIGDSANGDPGTDDTDALQDYFDHVSANDCGVADLSGFYAVSSTVTLGLSTTPLTRKYVGQFNLITTSGVSDGTKMLVVKDVNQGEFDYIRLVGFHSGSNTNYWSERKWECGLFLDGTQRTLFHYIWPRHFKFAGIAASSGNNTLNHYGMIKCSDCGSGNRQTESSVSVDSVPYGLTTVLSSPVNNGSADDLSQSTTLNATVLPPAHITGGTYGTLGESNYSVRIANKDGTWRTYWIHSVNSGSGTITVRPWVDANADFSKSTDYQWGGALYLRGGDCNVVTFDMIDAIRCGTALAATSLYSPSGRRVTTQQCGTAMTVGRDPSGSALGGSIQGLYCEANMEDLVYISLPTTTNSLVILNSYNLDLGKSYVQAGARNSANMLSTAYLAFDNATVADDGKWVASEKRPYGSGVNASPPNILIDRPDIRRIFLQDSVTLAHRIDESFHRITGTDQAEYIVYGTGPHGAPTGTISFEQFPYNVGFSTAGALVLTGSITSGSAVVTGLSGTGAAGIAVGALVGHSSLPNLTYVVSIDSATQVTLSANATATNASATLRFDAGRMVGLSGSTTTASAVVTGLPTTARLRAGAAVSGTGIPSATTVVSVDNTTQVTLSANATATGTPFLTFVSSWTIDGAYGTRSFSGFSGPARFACQFNVQNLDLKIRLLDSQQAPPGIDTVSNASKTLSPTGASVARRTQRWNSNLTADRTCTLPAAGVNGRAYRIVRSANAGGAFNLNINSSGGTLVKTLSSAGTYCVVQDNGTEYVLVENGTL